MSNEEQQEKEVQQMRREAVLSRAWAIARQMGASVVFQDFTTGIFTMQIHPVAMAMLENPVFQAAAGAGGAA